MIVLSVFLMGFVPLKMFAQDKKNNKSNRDAVVSEVSKAFFKDHSRSDQHVVFGMPISNAIKLVEEQHGIVFIYDVNLLKNKTVKYRKALPKDALEAAKDIVKGYSLRTVRLNEHSYAILPLPIQKENVLPKKIMDIQQETVKGNVTDASDGSPLPGVNVLVKGTTIGTATDAKGNYILNVPESADTLIYSYIGYNSKMVAINGRSVINIQLSPERVKGQQLVVVGYGTQKQKDITSSISSVSSEKIQNKPVQQVTQALQGEVAGVHITPNSGTPGGSLLIRVRGSGTVNNNQPLFVVDGNPVADPTDIDPNNIESIQVLKSASAAAIYGARGANGVIIITTKQGSASSGKTNLKINAYSGVQQVHRMIPLVSGSQYAKLYNTALVNGGEQPAFQNPGSITQSTNWQKAIFRPAPIRNIQLSASGGDQSNTYYVSGSYFQQKGIIIGSNYNRLSFRVNSSHKVNDMISIGENFAIDYAVQNKVPEFANTSNVVIQALQMDPTAPVKESNGNWGFSKYNSENPVAAISHNYNKTNRPNINGNLHLDINPIPSLTYHSQFNVNYGYSQNTVFRPTYYINNNNQNQVSSLTQSTNHWADWIWQNTLTYKKTVGNSDFKILAGVTAQNNYSDNINATGTELPQSANTISALRYLDLATAGQNSGGNAGAYGMLSFLGRVNYSYKDTYLATVNIRRDGSSKFGSNNRFGTFPSFSLGWRISNEPFMQSLDFIDNLKLRGGWGALGNQNSLNNYAFANTVSSGLPYPFGMNPSVLLGQAPTSLGNPNLKWEETKETDIGLDFTGFKNSVTFSADYYYKKTSNMLLQEPIPAYTGIQISPFVNGGDVVNRGIELSLEYQKTSPGGIYYDITANVSHNHNEVTKLSNAGAFIPSGRYQSIGNTERTAVGHPISSFYGYVMQGIFQDQAQINNHATQPNAIPGDVMFKDISGPNGKPDGVINASDQTFLGSPWPSMNYGLNADFQWKGFDLSMFWQGTYGNKIFSAWQYYTEGSNFFNYDKWALNSWHGKGTSNSMPILDIGDQNNNLRTSSFYVHDGSYVRLKNMQIGYTLPSRIIKTAGLSKLRIYISGENLLTFTKYRGFDPEIGQNLGSQYGNQLDVGVDRGYYPVARTITVGLNVSL